MLELFGRALLPAFCCLLSASALAETTAPKGCYERTWSKAELKKLPLQQVTAIRLEANLGKKPDSAANTFGRLKARFRETGEEWLSTGYECNDTGAGFACATHCDGSIFVLSKTAKGVQVMPPDPVSLHIGDCGETKMALRMNADAKAFVLIRRGSKACPAP